MTEYLTVSEVARHLRVSEDSVRRYIRRGRLRAHRVGGTMRIRRRDIEDFVQPHQPDRQAGDQPDAEVVEQPELDFLFANLDDLQQRYPGKWIAIREGRVAAAADDVPALLQAIEELGLEEPLITQIPLEPVAWDTVLGH